MEQNPTQPLVQGRRISLTRLINAPRELVWEAWTQPEHIRHWWGPEGFTNSISHMDVRPGGTWEFIMHGPDGTDFPNVHRYLEVVEHERLVLEHVSAPNFRMTATFTEEGGKTRIHIESQFESEEQLAQLIKAVKADQGLKQNMDKLEVYLRNPGGILVFERVYNASAERIWEALTDPSQMKQWYFDLPGFRAEPGYRFQFEAGPPGKDYLHLCEVKEAAPNKRLAYSWRYDGYPGDSLVRFELMKEGDKTRLRLTHSGLESFQAAQNPDLDAKNFEMGWTSILDGALAGFLESLN